MSSPLVRWSPPGVGAELDSRVTPPGFATTPALMVVTVVRNRSRAAMPLRPASPPSCEVVHDEQGRLYQKVGSLIRPLKPQGQAASQNSRPERSVQRILRFGDWLDVLKPQLANPNRLQPDHMLKCELQLQAGESPQDGFFKPSEPQIKNLNIQARNAPFQVRIRVCEDPTRELETAKVPEVKRCEARQLVPERFVRPWEFQLTREDALAQMKRESEPGLAGRLAYFLGRREVERAVERWLGELKGKDPLAQLWAVRPPGGAYRHAAVRQWLERTLETLGEDPYRAAREWEIFWRRKGV